MEVFPTEPFEGDGERGGRGRMWFETLPSGSTDIGSLGPVDEGLKVGRGVMLGQGGVVEGIAMKGSTACRYHHLFTAKGGAGVGCWSFGSEAVER